VTSGRARCCSTRCATARRRKLISSKFLTLRDGLLLRDAGEQDPIAAPGFATVAGHGRWSLRARCPGYLPRGSPSGGSGP